MKPADPDVIIRSEAAYRDASVVRDLVNAIEKGLTPGRTLKIMHVCGSHEHAVQQWGLRSLIPKQVEIFAGPGCPVCVCPSFEIGEALTIARKGAIMTTYGDMLRVPTPYGSLLDAKAEGADVRLVYSLIDAVRLAKENPGREVVFFSIGFETTAAPVAALVVRGGLPDNFSLLTSHRLTPPAMELLLGIGDVHIDGFIAPGHVSVILGANAWDIFPRAYHMPVVVAGFEPGEVLLGLLMLARQIREGKAILGNAYPKVVCPEGNSVAREAMRTAFDCVPAWWRGVGRVPRSGLVLKPQFSSLDARERFGFCIQPERNELPPGCSCHLVMLGKIYPSQCPLFEKKCTPATPYGPCMVSQEGTCLIWSKFGKPF
ncbi:MAG: hydrogenase formation protein HypD [Nitrospirae bacterium]|nr:hydrogenase formation protein HypD [Nitrospirota bacterium]MCL5238612.1 hydrogenase formation protein HypD [Nitrospirota bacterium]